MSVGGIFVGEELEAVEEVLAREVCRQLVRSGIYWEERRSERADGKQ